MSQILDETAEFDVLTLPPPAMPRRPGVVVAARTPLMRIYLKVCLEQAGFDVWAVASGVEVFETCLHHQEVDVLLVEADLPGLPPPVFYDRFRGFFPGLSCCFFAAAPGGHNTDEVRVMGATVISGRLPWSRSPTSCGRRSSRSSRSSSR